MKKDKYWRCTSCNIETRNLVADGWYVLDIYSLKNGPNTTEHLGLFCDLPCLGAFILARADEEHISNVGWKMHGSKYPVARKQPTPIRTR